MACVTAERDASIQEVGSLERPGDTWVTAWAVRSEESLKKPAQRNRGPSTSAIHQASSASTGSSCSSGPRVR